MSMMGNAAALEPIPCSHPALKPPVDAYEDLIKITVGPDGNTKTFHVYQGLLCFHAKYFAGLLRGGFEEAGSNSLRLAEVHTHVFQTFYYWMNSGGALEFESAPSWAAIFKAYVFADYHLAPEFKNALLDYILRSSMASCRVPLTYNRFIYENTSDRDSLRRWLVDTCVALMSTEQLRKVGPDECHSGFSYDLVMAVGVDETGRAVQNGRIKQWLKEHREHFCQRYHDHSQSEARLCLGNWRANS